MSAPLFDWLVLGIDFVRQWSLDRSYLELLTTAQLQELAAEWKLRSTDTKRGDLIGGWRRPAGRSRARRRWGGIKAVPLVRRLRPEELRGIEMLTQLFEVIFQHIDRSSAYREAGDPA